MGKTIERRNLNAKSHIPVFFFPRLLSMMAPKRSVHTGIHTHRHACALHMRVATTVSLCHEHERLCPLVSHETDGPSIRPAETPHSSPSCEGTQRAHPGGPGCRRHAPAHDAQLARRKHDHDGSARRWWREVPPRPNAMHNPVQKPCLDGDFCSTLCTVR